MITALGSGAEEKNPRFVERERAEGEDNVQWLKTNLEVLDDGVVIGLVGGWSPIHFPLRVAQASLRNDRTPSNWSHVFVFDRFAEAIREGEDLGAEAINEISLHPAEGFGYAPENNALQSSTLSRYADADEYRNIAVFSMPVEAEDDLEPGTRFGRAIDRFEQRHGTVDATGLVLRWLGYVWGIGGNPLDEGYGLPSAALVEEIALALDFDLTPGVESRASCPEAIWQAAKWWHVYYEETSRRPLTGAWWARHWLLYEEES